MQVQHGADVRLAVLVLAYHFLVIGLAPEGQRHPVAAQAGLDDVGDVVLALLLVEVIQALTGGLLMTAKVIVGAVGDAPQLAPVGEREGVLDVGGGAGVEGKLRALVVQQAQVLLHDAKGGQPVLAVVLPVGEPLQVGAGLAEELALHLLKRAGAQC